MSTWLYPVGPEPPGTYWMRRAGVLAIILLVLGLVWFLFLRGGGSGDAKPAASSSPSPSPASPSPTASSPSPTSSVTRTSSPRPTSTEITDCKDSVIEVEASTDDSSYPVGSTPRLTLKVTNGGNVPCLRDVGPQANELMVTSGGEDVWSSDDCNPSDTIDEMTLKPGESFSTSLTWDGQLSQPGCPYGQPAATEGVYEVIGRNGDVESEPTEFELT